MHSKRYKGILLAFLLMTTLFLFGCTLHGMVSSTNMVFSFDTSVPANSYDEKTLYVRNHLDTLTLDATLTIDSGSVSIQVVRTSDGEIVWSNNYDKNSSFSIELSNVPANSEYSLQIQATQSKKTHLSITSGEKLIQDKEKPAKSIVEKK